MISVVKITKRYGPFQALRRLSIEIGRGEIFGLVGPNGAGKTTALRILATIQRPTTGYAKIAGLNTVTQRRQVRAKIGFMPDALPDSDDISARDYLHFFAAAYGLNVGARKKAVAGAASITGIRPFLGKNLSELSRGMHQRLSLARAVVHNPKVLIFDEPASGLDPASRIEIKNLIRSFADEGRTVVFSSHILPEVAEITDRIGILDRGRLTACGTIDELVAGVRNRKTVSVEVAGDPMKALEKTASFPEVADVREINGRLIVELSEKAPSHSLVVGKLVGSGFDIISVEEQKGDVESVFLASTTPLACADAEDVK